MEVEVNVTNDGELYPYILSRHSIRSYDPRPLSEADQARLNLILSNVKPLIAENNFDVFFKSKTKGENLVEILGAYGRFITPPYYLVSYIIGEKMPLVDLGYRMEQITVRLWSIGIGSCFIGCLSRQEKVRQLFNLPAEAKLAAFLVLGYPGSGSAIQTITNISKSILGTGGRKPVEEVFYRDTFDIPASPPKPWDAIIEAARFAPSAVNAQPWRFLLMNEKLVLFCTRNNRKYYLPENENYCFHDGGLCMGNIALALASLGLQGEWHLLDGEAFSFPLVPQNLFPLATLSLK